jgi:hypothetical protein
MVPDARVLSSMKNEQKYHGNMTVWYTKGIYVSFVNCFVVILPHHKVTFAVVTRRSASGNGVSVLSVGDR